MLLVYGLSSTGMTLHVHYCCGKMKKVDWLTALKKKCGNEQNMGSRPCCETKQVTIKAVSDGYKNDFVFKNGKIFSFALLPNYQVNKEYSFKGSLTLIPFLSPPISSPPLYIRNGVFRI